MRNWARILTVALLAVKIASGQTPLVLSDDAARHLVKRTQAVYPEMAQIAHIVGEVALRFTISETGEVADVHAVSGHPLLVEAAQAALKQWDILRLRSVGVRLQWLLQW